MARVLYTVERGGRDVPAFVEAEDLAGALRQLAPLPSHQVRFWSHPFFGDPPEGDPVEAFRRARKPPRWRAWALVATMAPLVPGSFLGWALSALAVLGMPAPELPAPVVALATICTLLYTWLALLAFAQLRRELDNRHYAAAAALLRALRWGTPPFAFLFVRWAVRLNAGRHGIEVAMRPYRWLRSVGLGRVYDNLRMAAQGQLNDHEARIAMLEERVRKGGDPSSEADLALALVLYRRDAAAALATLEASSDAGARPLVGAWRRMVRAIIAAERGDAEGASDIEGAAADVVRAAPTASSTITPLIDATRARALALHGRIDDAVAALASAAPHLLWGAEHETLDAAAADVQRAIRADLRARTGEP